jgi:hypothetical protein
MTTYSRSNSSNVICLFRKLMLACIVLAAPSLVADQFPPQWANAVVALGSMKPVPGVPCAMQWQTEGTGFLYGYLVHGDPDPKQRKYEVFLVTVRHVIQQHAAAVVISKISQGQPSQIGSGCGITADPGDSISVRLNPTGSSLPGRQFQLPIGKWFFHPDGAVDVAAIPLNADFLKAQGVLDVFFANDLFVANREKLKSIGVAAGDGVFVLGFPMNLGGIQRNEVIVRQGCIARISDMFDLSSHSYLVDAFVFPGNSGSPVILRPELMSITGAPAQGNAYLIGLVTSYQTYIDAAISLQTSHPRITFEENSGLSDVLPTNYIDEAITAWRNRTTQPGP